MNGAVAVTGYYKGNVDFGGQRTTSVQNTEDIFVAGLSATGALQWLKHTGDTDNDRGMAIASDTVGNVAVTGNFGGRANFGGADLVNPSVVVSGVTVMERDAFLVKFTATGAHVWSKNFQPVVASYNGTLPQGVAMDRSGNVLLTGAIVSAVDFGGGPLSGSTSNDIFLAKFSPTGTHLWSNRNGSIYDDRGKAITSDAAGNVIATGVKSNVKTDSIGDDVCVAAATACARTHLGAVSDAPGRLRDAWRDGVVSDRVVTDAVPSRDRTRELGARRRSLLVSPEDLLALTGWELKPRGCVGGTCVCRRGVVLTSRSTDWSTSASSPSVLGRPFVLDDEADVAVLGESAATRAEQRAAMDVHDLVLHDVDGAAVRVVARSAARRRCSSRGPRGEAAVTTCPGGRHCTLSSNPSAARSSRSRSTKRRRRVRGSRPRRRPIRRSSIPSTSSPSVSASSTSRRPCGSTKTIMSCARR